MYTRFKIAIIDDQANCIDALSASLAGYGQTSLVGTAQTYQAARQLVLNKRPDLLFLDVEMPEISGIQFLREIKTFLSWPMHVVFYTAYEKYLLEALRESAFDYLLKPYTDAELQVVMDRFFSVNFSNHSLATQLEALSQIMPDSKTFMVLTITGYKVLQPGNVGFFEYYKSEKRWYAYTDGQTSSQLKRSTTAEMILNYAPSYVQINQHQIVNFDYLFKVDGKKCVLIPPFENQSNLAISKDFFKGFKEYFDLI